MHNHGQEDIILPIIADAVKVGRAVVEQDRIAGRGHFDRIGYLDTGFHDDIAGGGNAGGAS